MVKSERYTHLICFVLPQYENFYDHKFEPTKDSLVWSLDYDRSSDFDDCAGHWHLTNHPTKPVSL